MSDYQRGFNDGFAEALRRIERGPTGPTIANGRKIAIGFRQDQFEFIRQRAHALGCSFGASVRGLVDKQMPLPSPPRKNFS